MKTKIIIFDICDTMYNSNTTFDFLDYEFKENKRYMFSRKLSKTMFFRALNKSLKLFTVDFTRAYFLHYLKGYSKHNLEMAVDNFFTDTLTHKKRKWVIDELTQLRNDGKTIVLVSATIDVIAKRIADEFSVEYISSILSFRDDICSGRLERDLLGNKESFINDDIELVVTDNVSDLALAKKATRSIILSNSNNIRYWEKQKLKNCQIIKI